jgi:hypothetical protein
MGLWFFNGPADPLKTHPRQCKRMFFEPCPRHPPSGVHSIFFNSNTHMCMLTLYKGIHLAPNSHPGLPGVLRHSVKLQTYTPAVPQVLLEVCVSLGWNLCSYEQWLPL